MRLLILILCIYSLSASALGPPETMTRAEYDKLMSEISNWGRWSENDEIGTLNLITPEKRQSAAKLVSIGEAISLELDLVKVADEFNPSPLQHVLTPSKFGSHQVAGDQYCIDFHGVSHTHMDGLTHFAYRDAFYNNVPYSVAKASGSEKLGIEKMGESGVFTRGVLVDMPRHLGLPYLKPGTAITVSDLEDWERASGLKVSPGDVLLIRTGRWARIKSEGQWDILTSVAGLHASTAKWLKERGVSMIGSDAVSDVTPSGVQDLTFPLHELVIAGLGMPILDNLDLEELSRRSADHKRAEFLFIAAPLRVPGGTGSPLNPLAVF